MTAAPLLAGASEVTITPPVGVPLLGSVQPSTGVHDDLFARVLVLHCDARRGALVCLDLVGLDCAFADELRAEVQRQTGIAFVLLSCSHTHSAPFTIPWSVQGWEWFQGEGQTWRGELAAKVTGVVCQAAANLRPAALRVGRAPVQIGCNRRLTTEQGVVMKSNPQGAIVPWVDVLCVDTADGQPLAVLFSHAAHPVIVHATSTLMSADYPSSAVMRARQRLGGDVVAMFAQACGGDVNAEPLRGGFEAAEQAGQILGEATVRAAHEAEPLAVTELKTAAMTVTLPFQDLPTPEDCQHALREAEDRVTQAEREGLSDVMQWWRLRENVLCLRDLLGKVKRGEQPSLRCELHALAVGRDWCLTATPHELFAEYQLWMERASPFRHNMVTAYTNGCECYIPTDADLTGGSGYEAASFPLLGAALRYPYRVALRPGIEQMLRKSVTKLWRLFNDDISMGG